MKALLCPRCGQPLSLEGDHYRCAYCDALYTKEEGHEAEEALRSILEEAKMEALANRRRVLWDAAHQANVSTLKVFRAASDVREIYAEDPLARFYLACLDDDPASLNSFLLNESLDGPAAKEIIRFALQSISSRSVLALRDFIEASLDEKEGEAYLEQLTDLANRLDAGVYLTNLPRDVFLAYSSADMEAVIKTADLLEANGFSVFVAARNLRHGKGAVENYEKAIYDALSHCKCLVFLSSESSRTLDCDALKFELPFARDNLPKIGKVEYVIEPYGRRTLAAAKTVLTSTFHGLEWCKSEEDLIKRITGYVTSSAKRCHHCGEVNDPHATHCHKCGYPLDEKEYQKRINLEKASEEKQRQLEKALAEAEEKQKALQQKEEELLRQEKERELKRREEELARKAEELERRSKEPSPLGTSEEDLLAAIERAEKKREEERKKAEEEEQRKKDAYLAAIRLKEEGKLDDAIASFEALGDYEGAQNQLQLCLGKKKQAEEEEQYKPRLEGKWLIYGEYPQSKVKDASLIARLKDTQKKEGSPYLMLDGHKYAEASGAYFAVEPIRWKVVTANGHNIKAISERLLDAYPFRHQKDPFGNSGSYDTSDVKNWLGKDFLNVLAFPDKGKYMDTFGTSIVKPTLATDDEAKTWFPSEKERQCKPTAYAIAKGAYAAPKGGNGLWWTKTSRVGTSSLFTVFGDGSIDTIFYDDTRVCVRPVIKVKMP